MIAAMDVTLVVVLRKATTAQSHYRNMVGEIMLIHRTRVGGHQRPFLFGIALHKEQNRHFEVVADTRKLIPSTGHSGASRGVGG